MTEFDWKRLSEPAALIQALQAHRLLPVASFLAERGLLRTDLVPLAGKLAERTRDMERRRAEIEDEVLRALGAAGIEVLLLKGALLARTVYPAPEARIRTDIDLLVASDAVEDACAALHGIGFAPSYEVHGGPPMTQAQWIRRGDSPVHAVDLHWDLSNRPLLKDRFDFAALADRSVALPGHESPVAGLCPEDALLHACAHYFGHHRGEFRPDQWLLDMDLLWRSLDDAGPARLAEAALSIGMGSLVSAGMGLSGDRVETPLDQGWLRELHARSIGESSASLTRPTRFKILDMLSSAMGESGWGARMKHLRLLAFPPAEHMRQKYPGSSTWALPWLYVRRMFNGLKK